MADIVINDVISPGRWNLPAMIHETNYEHGIIIWLNKEAGKAKDLSKCGVVIEILDNTGIIDTLSSGSGLIIYPKDGGVLIKLDVAKVKTYPLGELFYRLKITEENGEIYYYVEGRIPVRE